MALTDTANLLQGRWLFEVLKCMGAPEDLELYVQESGRGGRDKKLTAATLYYCKKDIATSHSTEGIKYCENMS